MGIRDFSQNINILRVFLLCQTYIAHQKRRKKNAKVVTMSLNGPLPASANDTLGVWSCCQILFGELGQSSHLINQIQIKI